MFDSPIQVTALLREDLTEWGGGDFGEAWMFLALLAEVVEDC